MPKAPLLKVRSRKVSAATTGLGPESPVTHKREKIVRKKAGTENLPLP
jgi:hypothetical protein